MDETINTSANVARQLLRHIIATAAYRGGKAIANAPEGFADFRVGERTRTPAQILAHVGDLFDWALHLAKGEHVWRDSSPLPWADETARFFRVLRAFDDYLDSDELLLAPAERLFQGPIADALTHVGQIAMLRRVAGNPIKGENYFKAEIVAGRLGADPSAPRVEFD